MKSPSLRAWGVVGPMLAVLLAASPRPTPDSAKKPEPIIIGSKNFAESRLLGEIVAQLLEARGFAVARKFNLQGTQVCYDAVVSGDIDLYPEYTGTALVSILGREPVSDPTEALNVVRRELQDKGLHWLTSLGFENSYEIAVTRAIADRHGLRTLSDLVPIANSLRFGSGFEFAERADGLPGLARVYGLAFRDVMKLQQAVKYAAAASGDIDALDVYTTDGRLDVQDLVVLEDDRRFFPPYGAGLLVRARTLEENPRLAMALAALGDSLNARTMRRLNFRLQEGKEELPRVANAALADMLLVERVKAAEREPEERGWVDFLKTRSGDLLRWLTEHLVLSFIAVLLGIVVAVPLGLLLHDHDRVAEFVSRMTGILPTIPALALIALLVPFVGIGRTPAILAVWLYSLFPILRGTLSGLRSVPAPTVQAAKALGMTPRQLLLEVRLPLAMTVIMAGVRTAAVMAIGFMTLAAFVGAGGLGDPIITGVQLGDHRLTLLGAVPAAFLAVIADLLLSILERRVVPRGLSV